MHLHSLGKCEADSVAPTGGPAGDFNSAGGHFQAPGHTGHPASGDLTSLEVRSDGQAQLVTTTDAFTASDLLAGGKTALIIHERPDNFAHIPDRYVQKDGGAAGPDAETLATGDAGPRVACGVIESASAGTTTSSTTTSPTTTTVTTAPPTTTTEAPATPPPTTTTTPTPSPTETSTSTSTATITVPSVPEIPSIPPPVLPPGNP
jgi:Cu-Zn family superoxide dismutase